jgi:hypothetical protein
MPERRAKRCPRREKVNFESGKCEKKASSFRFKRQDIHTPFIRFRTEWLMYECMRNEKYSECRFTDPCSRPFRVSCHRCHKCGGPYRCHKSLPAERTTLGGPFPLGLRLRVLTDGVLRPGVRSGCFSVVGHADNSKNRAAADQ